MLNLSSNPGFPIILFSLYLYFINQQDQSGKLKEKKKIKKN